MREPLCFCPPNQPHVHPYVDVILHLRIPNYIHVLSSYNELPTPRGDRRIYHAVEESGYPFRGWEVPKSAQFLHGWRKAPERQLFMNRSTQSAPIGNPW